jgi:hypothetical protein
MDPNKMEATVVYVSPTVEEASGKADRKSSPTKGLQLRGFFWPGAVYSSPPKVKEASSSTLAAKEDSFASSQKMGPLIARLQATHTVSKIVSPEFCGGSSSGAAELGMRLMACLGVRLRGLKMRLTLKNSI